MTIPFGGPSMCLSKTIRSKPCDECCVHHQFPAARKKKPNMTFFLPILELFSPAKPINASGSVPLHDEAKMCYHKLLPHSAADLLLKCSHTNKELFFFCSQKIR